MSTSPATDTATRPSYLRALLSLGALMAITPITIDMYLPGLPSLVNDLNATTAQGTATVTGMLIGMAIGQIVIGPLSDAFGRYKPILLGLIFHVVISVVLAFAPSIEMLLVLRVLQGVVNASITVAVTASVRDQYSGRQAASLFAQLMLVLGVGPILAPALGSLVLQFTSWRGIFLVLAAIGLVLLLVSVFGIRESLPPERRRVAGVATTLRTYGEVLRDPILVAMLLVMGMTSAAMFTYISASPFIFQGMFGLNEGQFALLFGATAAGTILFVQLNPLLLRRFTPPQVMVASLVLAIVSSGLLVVVSLAEIGGVILVAVLIGMTNAFSSLAGPNGQAIGLHRHGLRAGSAAALLGASRFAIAGFAGPIVGIFLKDNPAPLGVLMASAMVIALIACVFSWKQITSESYL